MNKINAGIIDDINKCSFKDESIDITAIDNIFSAIRVGDLIQILKEFQFLRISAYAGCSFRCSYCNPDGLFSGEMMSTNEIIQIILAAHELGIRTVHFTGGEPTERNDFVELVKATKQIGMTTIDVTTNGMNRNMAVTVDGVGYHSMIEALQAYGLTGVSTSLDTFDPKTMVEIASPKNSDLTGEYILAEIKGAIEKSCVLFTQQGKLVVNMVVTKKNFHEIVNFIKYAQEMSGRFIPRFCEMQNKGPAYGDNQNKFHQDYISREKITQALESLGIGNLIEIDKERIDKQNAHAEYFTIGDDKLIVGLIAPFSQNWPCTKAECNRIRVGPNGAVNSCLDSPHYCLNGKSYADKLEILKQVIYQKIVRILNDNWPDTHRTDYLKYRFGIDDKVVLQFAEENEASCRK